MNKVIATLIIVVVFTSSWIFFSVQKPEVYSVREINNTPRNYLEDDPNLTILSSEKKNRTYRFVIISDQINESNYWNRYGKQDAILTTSDYSGLDGQGKRSMIFSDTKPDPKFFKVKE